MYGYFVESIPFCVILLQNMLYNPFIFPQETNMTIIIQNELLLAIENRRKELIELGLIKGLQDPHIIKLSEELDHLIIKYQKLFF